MKLSQRFEGPLKILFLAILTGLIGVWVYITVGLHRMQRDQHLQDKTKQMADAIQAEKIKISIQTATAQRALPLTKKRLLEEFPGASELPLSELGVIGITISTHPAAVLKGDFNKNEIPDVLFFEMDPLTWTFTRMMVYEERKGAYKQLLALTLNETHIDGREIAPKEAFPHGPRCTISIEPTEALRLYKDDQGRLAVEDHIFAGTAVALRWNSQQGRFLVEDNCEC